MSQKYLGGVITANPTTPTLSAATGVWTMEQQFQNITNWPKSTGLVSRSVRLRSSATAYLNRTPTATSNQQVLTISCWVKRGKLGASQNLFQAFTSASTYSYLYFTSGDVLNFANVVSSVGKGDISTNAVFRDPAAWYHVVLALNYATPSATIYVNGVVQSVTVNTALVASNLSWNTASIGNYIGSNATPSNTFDGYLAEVNFIDGQALTPSYFGFTDGNGVWQPATYSGTYGTNGFYLNFSDNSAATATTIGKDYSGNGNNWTPNNISVTAGATYDSMLDVPTPYADGGNGRGNYCVMNPLSGDYGTFTLSSANLNFSGARTATATAYARSTIGVSSGKWYWEVSPTDVGAGPNLIVGIQDASTTALTAGGDIVLNGYGYNASSGYKNNNTTQSAYGASYAAGDVIGIALDLDAGTIVFYKNNTSQGTAFTGITGTYCPVIVMNTGGVARTVAGSINFGQRPFTYTPPSGYVALNTYNL